MKNVMQRGFTLIELLVVIAIIGILAAVVLGSLNDARDNANDASAQTSVNNIRNVAEIFYSENGFTYGDDGSGGEDTQVVTPADTSIATAGNSVCDTEAITDLMLAAANQTRNDATCFANDNNYAVEVDLRGPSGSPNDYYCIDSTGSAGTHDSSTIGTADLACGS